MIQGHVKQNRPGDSLTGLKGLSGVLLAFIITVGDEK